MISYNDKMSLNFYKNETEKVCKSKGWDRANDHANENADQQIGDDNGDDCEHEREKLLTPSKPHLFEGGWTCQFETSVHQDGSKAGKGNAIEQVGEEGYRRE